MGADEQITFSECVIRKVELGQGPVSTQHRYSSFTHCRFPSFITGPECNGRDTGHSDRSVQLDVAYGSLDAIETIKPSAHRCVIVQDITEPSIALPTPFPWPYLQPGPEVTHRIPGKAAKLAFFPTQESPRTLCSGGRFTLSERGDHIDGSIA